MCDLEQKSSASWQGESSWEDLGVQNHPTIIPLLDTPSFPEDFPLQALAATSTGMQEVTGSS